MHPTILLVATLDTKEEEAIYLKKVIEERGCNVVLLDAGILSSPRKIEADITRKEVAKAGGTPIDKLLNLNNKGKCIDNMIKGVENLVQKYFEEDKFSGIIGIGGAQGTNIGTSAMKKLPYGVPKLMVSTVACGTATFGPFVGTKDITIMHSVADIQGVNFLTTTILENAASAICGMVKNYNSYVNTDKVPVAMSMLGTTTPGALRVKELLGKKDFEVVAFHQNGTGGIAMENLIHAGKFKGVLDINLHELADQVVGGLHAAIEDYRLDSVCKTDLPQVIAPGSIDYTVQGPVDSLSDEMKNRKYIVHNPTLTLVKLSYEEMVEVGRLIASKINKAKGSISVFLPLKGFSYPNRKGLELWDYEKNMAFINSFKDNVDSTLSVEEVDAHINDEEFIDRVVDEFISLIN